MTRHFSVDHAGRRSLRIDARDGAWELTLVAADADTRSPYHRALVQTLLVTAGGLESRLDPVTESVVVPMGEAGFEVSVGKVPLLSFRPPDEVSTAGVLSPFEIRFLADNGVPHSGARGSAVSALHTDLHTHFAGCVSGEDVLAIGLEAGVSYPRSLLAEAGIRSESEGELRLDTLTAELHARLAAGLRVPLDRRVPFVEMERIYRLRAPITKNPAAFVPLCRRLAHDYAAMGVTYVELSLSNIVEAARLAVIHRELPAIEEESGVTLRFLAALSRHDDLEWDLDLIDRFKEIARSRYFVGVDFMGHETNSTRAFARQIREIAAWASADRPGFAIRVHAGENPAHPENVRVAAECVLGQDVRLRVGHGLYGVDDRTERLLLDVGAIVEFNLSSNLALNNIQSAVEVPIRRYVEAGVPVVLGTDGYGIYQTTLALEAQAAEIAGLDASHLARIAETEARYVDDRTSRDERSTSAPAHFAVPPDPPSRHYTEDVPERKEREKARRAQALADRLAALSIPLLPREAVSRLLEGKVVLSIAGAWRKSWESVSAGERDNVRRELRRLFEGLTPGKTVLVTGGTTWGVEHEAQTLAKPLGFTLLATLVAETPAESISPDLTHAFVVGKNLHAKAAGLYALMREANGLSLFIGGGPIVADEIQAASNLRLRYLVMDGPEGASTRHAARHPSRSFRTADEVLARLSLSAWTSTRDPYWHLGPNPTVDIVLVRRNAATGRREILLVERDVNAACEPGMWALPGGFQLTDAPRGAPWAPGRETVREACVRELLEETGIDVSDLEARLLPVGEYEGEGRDPRDTKEAWSRSVAFALALPPSNAAHPIAGGDDASDARWFPLGELPGPLAFDHVRIVADGLARLDSAASPEDASRA